MTVKEAIDFIEAKGIVLESARGPVPNLAEKIAGEEIPGSWWAHRKSREIFKVTRAVRDSDRILVCRMVQGKITLVHRRLWPAVVRMAGRIPKIQLRAIREIHTTEGKHRLEETPFPNWVAEDIMEQAKGLSEAEATTMLEQSLPSFFTR